MQNIDSIFDKSKYIAVQENQIQLLKELIKEKLTVGHLGGLFLINSELLNFLDLLERSGYDSAVINDMNDNPTEITNIKEFKKQESKQYQLVLCRILFQLFFLSSYAVSPLFRAS